MKPTIAPKKKPAKRARAVKVGSIEHKLMKLKNRIDGDQTSAPKHIDREWVEMKLEDVRNNVVLDKGIMLRCNDLWRKYG